MAKSFDHFNEAARALIHQGGLSEKEGQFCGGLCFRSAPLSEKQLKRLTILLSRYKLPPMAAGSGAVKDG